MLSRLVRVELEYAMGHGPDSVVVKLPTPNEANRQTAIDFQNYRREVLFYRDLASQTPARMPIVYYADIIGLDQFVLVMEDLGGYRVGESGHRCDRGGSAPRHDRDGGAACAVLGARRCPRSSISFLCTTGPTTPTRSSRERSPCGTTWSTIAGDVLSPEVAAIKNRFLAALPRLQEWITAPPRTIVQGDFRMDNLFFGESAQQAPIAICDWQGPLRCKGVHDLAYFLSRACPAKCDESTSASWSPFGTLDWSRVASPAMRRAGVGGLPSRGARLLDVRDGDRRHPRSEQRAR